jgi:hypothetical protein
MTCIIRIDLEKREPGKSFILLDENNPYKGPQNIGPVMIEPGGIVQIRYRGRRVGIKITKAAAHEIVGEIISLENAKEKNEDVAMDDFILFQEENIFGYDPPLKS